MVCHVEGHRLAAGGCKALHVLHLVLQIAHSFAEHEQACCSSSMRRHPAVKIAPSSSTGPLVQQLGAKAFCKQQGGADGLHPVQVRCQRPCIKPQTLSQREGPLARLADSTPPHRCSQ